MSRPPRLSNNTLQLIDLSLRAAECTKLYKSKHTELALALSLSLPPSLSQAPV